MCDVDFHRRVDYQMTSCPRFPFFFRAHPPLYTEREPEKKVTSQIKWIYIHRSSRNRCASYIESRRATNNSSRRTWMRTQRASKEKKRGDSIIKSLPLLFYMRAHSYDIIRPRTDEMGEYSELIGPLLLYH